MKLSKGITYRPVVTWSAVLGTASLACGWGIARGLYPLMLVCVPLMALSLVRILHCYGESVRRVTFMFQCHRQRRSDLPF